MAAKKYIDADGDFSHYLQMSDLGSHLLSTSSEPAHHQPAANDFLSLSIGGLHYQAPATVAVPPPQMPVPEQAGTGYSVRRATLVEAPGAGASSGINGQLDCTKSCTVRELLHESDNKDRAHFTARASDQGQFQHVLIHKGMQTATQTGTSLYHDLSKRMHEWVHSFKANQEETTKTDNTGSLKDSWPGFCVTNYAEMSVSTHNNAQKEVEVGTLKDTLSASAQNGEDDEEAASDDSTQQNVAQDIRKAFDWAGFHPFILESSQVPKYNGASGASATMHPPSLCEIRKEPEQASHSKLSIVGASEKYESKTSEKRTDNPNLSSKAFKLLCSKNKTFCKHANRINVLKRRIKKFEAAITAGSTRQCFIKERMEKYKQEKVQLLETIKKGVQQRKKSNNGVGPSR